MSSWIEKADISEPVSSHEHIKIKIYMHTYDNMNGCAPQTPHAVSSLPSRYLYSDGPVLLKPSTYRRDPLINLQVAKKKITGRTPGK